MGMKPLMAFFDKQTLGICALQNHNVVQSGHWCFGDQSAEYIGRNVKFSRDMFDNSVVMLDIQLPLE